jgi:hypothetical protein
MFPELLRWKKTLYCMVTSCWCSIYCAPFSELCWKECQVLFRWPCFRQFHQALCRWELFADLPRPWNLSIDPFIANINQHNSSMMILFSHWTHYKAQMTIKHEYAVAMLSPKTIFPQRSARPFESYSRTIRWAYFTMIMHHHNKFHCRTQILPEISVLQKSAPADKNGSVPV